MNVRVSHSRGVLWLSATQGCRKVMVGFSREQLRYARHLTTRRERRENMLSKLWREFYQGQ